MRESILPPEFQFLNGKVHYVQQVTHNEWSSSCPQCGGTIHKGGEFPDRFRMWTNARGKNKVLGWCRHCSCVWFPDSDKPMDPREFERWRQEQLEREERIRKEAEIAIAHLRSERIWEYYNKQLNDWSLSVIQEQWGIDKNGIDYWELGMVADYTVHTKEGDYHSPGITIPLWQQDGGVANVKVRVLNPRTSADRYRSLYKVGGGFLFTAWRGIEHKQCLIVEGEKKAMVCAKNLGYEAMQVVGVPTKTPNLGMLKQLDRFERLVVCLDPDAAVKDEEGRSPLGRMVDALGRERVAVLRLPYKIDDMIVENGLEIKDALRGARQLEAR